MSDANVPQTFHMVASDLDGTLLQSNHTMTDETADYLRELEAKGFHIMIATGRSATTVYDHILRLHPLTRPLPVVCSNGARGLLCRIGTSSDNDNKNGTVLVDEVFSTPVPLNVALRTMALAKKLGHVTQYYVGETIYANPSHASHLVLTKLYQELTGCTTAFVDDDFQQAMEEGLPSKMLVLCPPEQQDDMMTEFYREFDKVTATIICGSMGWFLEVLHPEVCKGHGLARMCEHLNVDINRVVAFGDADNDLEFIQQAGRGIVMKNGRDVVKQVADEVLDWTNDEEGVRKSLQRMHENGQLVFQR
jgi:hypothetical protein